MRVFGKLRQYGLVLTLAATLLSGLAPVIPAHAAGVLTDAGLQAIMARAFNNTFPVGGNDITIHLFCNDHTPTDADTTADYTECAGGNYDGAGNPSDLITGSWTVTSTGGIPVVTYTKQTWTFSGPLTTNTDIYGSYYTDADDTLLWASKAPATFTPASNGDTYSTTPTVKVGHGTAQ